MRHLITGGAGFIGSHLAELLLQQGDEVTVLDDLSSGKRENIEYLESKSSFRLVVGSALDGSVLKGLISSADVVYHLAASVGVLRLLKEPVHVMHNNIGAVQSVLRAIDESGSSGCKIVFASSSEVYGELKEHPSREDDSLEFPAPTDTRWSYRISKAVGESMCLAYARERKMRVVVVRLFNTIGPRQNADRGPVVPRLVTQAVNGKPMTIFGDGRQTRSFASVREVVDAISRLAKDDRTDGEIFNVGANQEISILELADKIRLLAKSDSPIEFHPYEEVCGAGFVDVRRRVPDLTKLERVLGTRMPLELDETLADIVRSHQHVRHARP